MTPVATSFFFYLLASATVLGGLLVITCRSAVRSALALIVTLLAVAGLYLMLYAPFVAGAEVLVYAGGIMVLFLLAIMFTWTGVSPNEPRFLGVAWIGIPSGCALLAFLIFAFVKGRELFPDRMIALGEESNTQQIASLLYGEPGRTGSYTFAFEIASLLLLVAILGAVVKVSGRGVAGPVSAVESQETRPSPGI
jgi:NADH-quinone oxidoreductase subunit J